jgi:hypothetical protein
MNESATDQFTPAFRGSGSVEWRPLPTADGRANGKNDKTKSNRDDLKNLLLASLQMQHLVVLAGSGCSLSAAGPSMDDLWKHAVGKPPNDKAKRVAGKVHHDLEKNRNLEELLSRIEAFLHVQDDACVLEFLNESKRIIIEKCSEFLNTGSLGAHKTFLHRLSRRRIRDQRLKVFTTNYDLCFERAASEVGGVALDGFSFTAPRQYDPRYFAYDIVRRPRGGDDLGNYLEGVFLLYKFHGSVNWARSSNGTISEKTQPTPEEACLIYPATGKYQQSYTQPHLEAMAQYLAAIREPNTCVIVAGFGFNDDHLSEPLLAAARSNSHLRLIIADPGAEAKAKDKEHRYWPQLFALGQKSEDIWFISAGFEALANMIPDLKALTPADALIKAIKGVTGSQ